MASLIWDKSEDFGISPDDDFDLDEDLGEFDVYYNTPGVIAGATPAPTQVSDLFNIKHNLLFGRIK